jgi:hypothetical protein
MRLLEQRNSLIDATVLFLPVWFVSYLCVPLRLPFGYIIPGFLTFMLVILFALNLFAVFISQQRIGHVIIIFGIVAAVACFWLCVTIFENSQRQWFFKSGRQVYELEINKITRSKATLTSKSSSLNNIVGHSGVYGFTNADGSIIVWFARRSYSRGGCYLYYSGTNMTINPIATNIFIFPDNPGRFYMHLTNGWYEHY